jgi:endoglucanase
MKKSWLLTGLLFTVLNTLYAQLPNGNFENWTWQISDNGLNLWRPPHAQNAVSGQGDKFELYKLQPCFVWTGLWDPNPQITMAGYVSKAAGKVIPLCIYGYPRTGYSSGGFNTLPEYQTWINGISAGLGSAPCMLVLEPDALGLHTNMADGTTPESALNYALTKFKSSNANTHVYIEASSWIDVTTQSSRLRGAGIAQADGFVTNVSNFNPTLDMVAYCENLNAQLVLDGVAAKKYLIDTGRNGNGTLTTAFGPTADPWISRKEEWLNPPGRGLGLSPRANPDPTKPNFVATVWVKSPGESDGNNPGSTWVSTYFPSNAPNAGGFWLDWIKDCLDHTDINNLK